jgi:uncharacterized protein (TIGR01370 family)
MPKRGGVLAVAVIASVWLTGTCGVADAAPRDPRLDDVSTFAFALGSKHDAVRLDRLAKYDLVVVDGVDSTQPLIDGLKTRGVMVLGYLSVGTIERNRPWSLAMRPYRLERRKNFDEWYADVTSPGFRELVRAEVAPGILDRGFDGLFLDNTDMVSSHREQRGGMNELVHSLAGLVHSRRRMLFTQNGEDVIDDTLDLYDGWNREDVSSTYSFKARRYVHQTRGATRAAQRALRRIAATGIFVTATDYVPANDRSATRQAVRNACDAGAVPFASSIELDRVPLPPLRCP